MALTNCSINQGSIVVGASAAIGSTSNIVLTITPDAGYVLSESDFTIASPPTGISTITKANTATAYAANNTVSITCDLDDSYVVGTTDETFTIDVDGAAILARLKPISVSGTFTYSGTNTDVTSETGSYTNSGFEGETEVVLTKTFTASSGYYFTSDPTVTISAGSYNNKYSISNGNRVYDSDNNLTAVTVTISYTYPSVDQTGHTISLTLAAVQLPTINRLITNASTATNSFSGGTTRPLTVTSTTTDSNYAITVARTSDSFTYDFTTDTFTSAATSDTGSIGSTGVFQKDIIYPTASSGDTYNISVAGDGTTTLTTQNVDTDNTPFTLSLSQVAPISITIDAESSSQDFSFGYTNCGPHSLTPNSDYQNPNTGESNLIKAISIVATGTSGKNLHLRDTTPEFPTDFDNTDPTSNGGIDFDIEDIVITGNGTNTITLTGNLSVYTTETSSVVSSFLADNIINTAPVSSALSLTVARNASGTVTLSSTDYNNDTLTHALVGGLSSSTGTISLNGDVVTYTNNGSTTLSDTFQYKANDGLEDGNTATVSITITNTAPVSSNISIAVNKGGSKVFSFSSTDAENDTLTHSIVANPSVGSLSGVNNAGGTYTHNNSSTLTDSFTYRANDGISNGNTATANIAVGVAPGSSITTQGDEGIYLVPMILGTDAGTLKVHFNAQGVPDRFQILFDTAGASNDLADMEVVADSLYVGDSVSMSSPTNGTTTGANEYTYVGSGGNATGTGEPGAAWDKTGNANKSIIVSDTVVTVDTTDRSSNPADTTSLGVSRNTSGTQNTQTGVQAGVFTSNTATSLTTGLDRKDGNVCLYYTKSATTAYTAYLRVLAPTSGTAWNIHQTEFSSAFGYAFAQASGPACSTPESSINSNNLAYFEDDVFTNGKKVYIDSDKTQVLVGNGNVYKFFVGSGAYGTVSSTGVISSAGFCGTP